MLKKVGLVGYLLVALCAVGTSVVLAQEEATEAESIQAVTQATPIVYTAVNVGNKICPVTGKEIQEPGKYTVEYEGKIYNLCSAECKEEFLKDPDTYVSIVEDELSQETQESSVEEAEESRVEEVESSTGEEM